MAGVYERLVLNVSFVFPPDRNLSENYIRDGRVVLPCVVHVGGLGKGKDKSGGKGKIEGKTEEGRGDEGGKVGDFVSAGFLSAELVADGV